MLSYRKKVLISNLAILMIFLALLFPFVGKIVQRVAKKSLEERAQSLIQASSSVSNLSQMIDFLKKEKNAAFFRVSLIDKQGYVLYDSHVHALEDQSSQEYLLTHPEVIQAFEKGHGYNEGYSNLFDQDFAYVAVLFHLKEKSYVLRTAFPLKQVHSLIKDFRFSYLTFGILVLLLFFAMTALVWNRLTYPIHQILNKVRLFNEGKEKFLSEINLDEKVAPDDDFRALANTLNSLTQRVKQQIEILTAQKNENEFILESLIEGIIAIDVKDCVTFMNSRASDLLGIPKKLFPLQTLLRNKEVFQEIIEAKNSAKKNRQILVRPLKLYQKKKYLDLIVIPNKSSAILVFQDKTSDYKMLEMGKDFIANASHELKTPITIIRGYAETLQRLPEISEPMLQEITQKIVQTCSRLNELVKSLLTLADIENLAKVKLYKLDLVLIVENCIDLMRSTHEKASIQLIKQIPQGFIAGDANLLDLAITNILENAVRYSSEPANITVHLKEKNDSIYLSFGDKGIGIPKEDLEHIFGRFYTVDKARSRKSGGVGLGLSIVKTIIGCHKANIAVQSTLGEGTSFTLTFPKFSKKAQEISSI